MGAGVVIHIGRELLSEKACSRIFRVQLLLALALIVLACSHLVLLHFRISGSYFYFLYPLQQLLLFTAYALTPAVHALVLQIEVDSRVQQPCDKVADGSMGRFRDYRIIAAYEAFSATFLFACWVNVFIRSDGPLCSLPFTDCFRFGAGCDWLMCCDAARSFS